MLFPEDPELTELIRRYAPAVGKEGEDRIDRIALYLWAGTVYALFWGLTDIIAHPSVMVGLLVALVFGAELLVRRFRRQSRNRVSAQLRDSPFRGPSM